MSTTNKIRNNQLGLLNQPDIRKIEKQAIDGLAGTPDSLAYKIHEIENHLHSSDQVFGLTTNAMARKSISPIVVTGGNGAWGTELLLTDGTVIESGSTIKKFDLGKLIVSAIGTSARPTALEFYYGSLDAARTSVVITDATDLFTKAGHGLVNGDQVILSSIVTTTGITAYTVYYIVSMAGNDFQVSLTVGGAAVVVGGGNGTCSVQKVTKTLLTECIITGASTDTVPQRIDIRSPRVPCNSIITSRGWSGGGTNAISFYVTLHSYSS